MLAFYGDIGRDHAGYSPLVSRVGYELHASTPISSWLEAGLFAMHGRVGVNEHGLDRNLNIESRITTGGLRFIYNFDQFLAPDRVVEPFFSLGFESMEFLSKADHLDAQGRPYNYWSDGTIRDIPEDAPNAEDAVIVQRDYVYESDIRELDLDGFGRYDERTFAVPVGIGARMRLGGGFDLRLSTTMHFTMSDMIDGITDESLGMRKGDGRKDRLLFSSVTVSYGINTTRRSKVPKPTLSSEEMDLLVLNEDEDADGIADMLDRCPGTPAGAKVDANGCPLDGDGDGVPDHLDDEPDTPSGAIVDARGVQLTDDDLLAAYLNYKDSANATLVTGIVESIGGARPTKVIRPGNRTYVVQVGSQQEGISEEMMQLILSIPDVRTIEQGDTTFYVVGDYELLPEAVKRQLALGGSGISGRVMAEERGRLIDVSGEAATVRVGLNDSTLMDAASSEAVIRVQLGAFRGRIAREVFSDVPDMVVLKGDDGLTRYYTGSFTDVNQAARRKVDMLLQGFDGAFLVAFKEGRRVSLQEAGARLTRPEDLREIPLGSINKEHIRFRVQVGTFAGNVPTDIMGRYIEVGDVTSVTSSDAVRYFYGTYDDRASAEVARREMQYLGFEDAFVVGEVDGRIISAEEAERLLTGP
ncbi:MAG: hypothetical protein KDC03_03335 [Flavobacteriales bacterium]|nr:hypothetical protein [Flavobacteriales bacterium]